MPNIINYIRIARPDHWFKNVFMLPGIVLAFLFLNLPFDTSTLVRILLGVCATCLVASANYTINEVLDSSYDKEHPVKKNRPAALGLINNKFAYLQYFLLIIAGLALSYRINYSFLFTNVALLVMGILYNVPPFRTKDVIYLDVISESINNPIRLVLGWFIVSDAVLPPLSLIIAYWMVGAFFMGMKRLAEIRLIGNDDTVKSYRKSLGKYNEDKLLQSLVFYASLFSFTAAIVLVRYKFELILLMPLLALLVSEYMRIGSLKDSPVQYPEKLYKQKKLVALCFVILIAFLVLIFVKIPWLAHIFDPQIQINLK